MDTAVKLQEGNDEFHLEISRLNSELRLASAALVTSQEMERKRIAAELHDGIGQALNTISFTAHQALDQLKRESHDELETTLKSLRDQVRDTIEEVRRISLDLRPAMLDDLGVIGTLSWFFRQLRSVNPAVALNCTIEATERDIPLSLRTPIYRIVQESVSNALKHGRPTAISVTLTATPEQIALKVGDNGSGFIAPANPPMEPSAPVTCGLRGMRNRVEFSGGGFSLESTPGGGTRVFAIWPLQSH